MDLRALSIFIEVAELGSFTLVRLWQLAKVELKDRTS